MIDPTKRTSPSQTKAERATARLARLLDLDEDGKVTLSIDGRKRPMTIENAVVTRLRVNAARGDKIARAEVLRHDKLNQTSAESFQHQKYLEYSVIDRIPDILESLGVELRQYESHYIHLVVSLSNNAVSYLMDRIDYSSWSVEKLKKVMDVAANPQIFDRYFDLELLDKLGDNEKAPLRVGGIVPIISKDEPSRQRPWINAFGIDYSDHED